MSDFARSSDPEVQRQLDRLAALSPGGDILGLARITRLLARLGDPHRSLPPVFHVAGTNGKGSTCAFLRAALEAAGYRVHAYTSPHLVRFNERIRLSGMLIEDAQLARLLAEVLDICGDAFSVGGRPSFFEVTTAAAFLAFARTPADACVIEVGLGGRLDATNVIEAPAVTGIAGLGLDHQFFLGDRLEMVAMEKAGIAKRGVPLVTLDYADAINEVIFDAAMRAGATFLPAGGVWHWAIGKGPGGSQRLHVTTAQGAVMAEMPALAGDHQCANAALALAMVRAQTRVDVPVAAQKVAPARAAWPARLQALRPGPLTGLLPASANVWLDGAHNPAAAQVVAEFLSRAVPADRPLHIVIGLLANKDARGVLAPLLARDAVFHAVEVPGHASHEPSDLVTLAREAGRAAHAADSVAAAFGRITDGAPAVLVMGSLYLAGEVLAANGQLPT